MSKLNGSVRLLALGALFAVGGLTAIALTPSQRASASQSTVPGVGIVALGSHLTGVADPGLYSTDIASASQAATLAGLPGRSLAYFSGTDVNVNWSTGVPYSQALANGWLLAGSTGSLLTNTGYAGNYVGDVGSSAYQQAWITNVLAYLGAHPGIDGVFIDDVLYDLKPLAGTEAAKYPTQSQWAAAMLSFVKAVGNGLRSHGYYVALNASGYVPGDTNSNDGTNTVVWWKQVGPYVNGLMNEYYNETSNGTYQLRTTGGAWYQQWDAWQRLIGTAQAMGDDFFGLTYSGAGNTAAMQYGRASFLLDWDGGGGAFMYGATDGSDPTSNWWTTSIGQPAASKQQVGVGWKRLYAGGIALVNPSAATAQTFSLGGSYTSPSGATVTSVTLQPGTGMVLTGSASTPETTTSTTTTAATTTTNATTTTTTATTTTSATTTTPTTTPTTPSQGGRGHRKPPKKASRIGVRTGLSGYRTASRGVHSSTSCYRGTGLGYAAREHHHGRWAVRPARRPPTCY
jgi:putative glycosyl hydrolase-like family 15 (GHL15) protein